MKTPMPRLLHAHRARGFTLLELMVTVSLGAILLGIGIPSFNSFIQSQRVKTATYELSAASVLARSEAIKRNVTVVVRPTVLASGWAGGWQVVETAGNTVLGEQVALPGLTVTTDPDALASVTYGRDGRPAFSPGLSSGKSKAEITFTGGSNARCLLIDLSGMPGTKSGACS